MKELFLFTRDQLSILTKNIFYYISKESAIVCGTCRYGHQRVISFYQRSIVYINQGIGSPKFLLQSLIFALNIVLAIANDMVQIKGLL